MTIVFVLNDPPYGSEHTYSGLRLAGTLARRKDHQTRVFLMGDAVTAAKAGQEVPDGYYNVERMLRIATSGENELADWVEAADRVLVF